jgi:hypothetical protein
LGEAQCHILASTQTILTETFHAFLQSFLASTRSLPELGLDCFLPNPFQFITYQYSIYLTPYNLATDSVINHKKLIFSMVSQVHFQVRLCGFCHGQSGTGAGFSEYVRFPCQFSFHISMYHL